MMTNEEVAAAIASRPGDKVTLEYMTSRIAQIDYSILPKSTVTLCSITLDNGYSVRGESACVDPLNFNKEIGEKIAHDNAVNKLWPLFGFLLAEGRHLKAKAGQAVAPAA